MKSLLLIALLLAAGPVFAQPTAAEAAAACSLPAGNTARAGCINTLVGFAMGIDETIVLAEGNYYVMSFPANTPYTEFVNLFVDVVNRAPANIKALPFSVAATNLFVAKYGKRITFCKPGATT